MPRYSEEYQQAVVAKLLAPHNLSAGDRGAGRDKLVTSVKEGVANFVAWYRDFYKV